jgi:formylglycine-generating enzyme required for sulfatase activity
VTRANYGNKVGHITPVGAYPAGATPEGLMDMAGNVWEWMENWFDENKGSRALRGGSYYHDAEVLRGARRAGDNPADRSVDGGFRVCVAGES